jgi:hypothetical protein
MEGSTETKSPKFTRKVRRGLWTIFARLPDPLAERLAELGHKRAEIHDAEAALAWIKANMISPDLVEAVAKLAETVGLDPSTPSGLEPAPEAYAPERAVGRSACIDCGMAGERTGHQNCQYPGRFSEGGEA